jgi:acyl-CoA synthetase (AMP-forming)/AMP-acid ligase II
MPHSPEACKLSDINLTQRRSPGPVPPKINTNPRCDSVLLVVDELPRNAMGKVQKNVLRAAYATLYGAGAAAR